VVANYENASHGFGLSAKNASELFGYGIDAMTGGNHSFDKKDIIPHLETMPLLRPLNYPETLAGEGVKLFEVQGARIALLNLMGHYSMPMVDNPFIAVQKVIERVEADYILIDFHAEVTSEKNTLFELLKGKVSAIVGTHTHVGTDDLKISHGTGYVSDIGLSGCFDGVIGMESSVPIKKALTGIGGHFDIPKK
jgi:metallophosphoesterase (TIGR00282 family)